ncbi:hypothetical protein Tco_0449449 [Tanacetum coccineum]
MYLRGRRRDVLRLQAVSGPEEQPPAAHQAIEERIKVAINPDYPEQKFPHLPHQKKKKNSFCILRGPEVNYTSMEKLVLALVHAIDFIVERPEEDDLDTAMDVEEELPKSWTLFTDGSLIRSDYTLKYI